MSTDRPPIGLSNRDIEELIGDVAICCFARTIRSLSP
jgi:hypothetical protein